MAPRLAPALLLLALAAPAFGQGRRQPAPDPACGGEMIPDRIAAIAPSGEIALASGGLGRLADIALAEEPAIRAEALRRLREQVGRPVLAASGPPDRWDRRALRPAPADGSVPGLARDLIAAGLALVDPGEGDALCDPGLLAVEAEARGKRMGVWAGAAPLPAEPPETARAWIGRFALVEGRVRSVGERPERTYLNFGRAWSEDFTVTIPKQAWLILKGRGVSAASLRGRLVRVRGMLEEWNGPALTLRAPETLEILDAPSNR